MIRKVKLKYFKRFQDQEFILADHVVLAGPNNAGKTTLAQAINTWHFALRRWMTAKYRENGRATGGDAEEVTGNRLRSGVPITRKELSTVPLRELSLLWTDTSTALSKDELGEGQKLGTPRVMTISLSGVLQGQPWELAMEFRYANSELLYIKPSAEHLESVPKAAKDLQVVHVPPFSGIGAEETGMDRPYQELLIGQGKAGDLLRNLLWELYQLSDKSEWGRLVADIEEIFGYRLLPPEYEGRPFILCEYLPGIPPKRGLGGLPRLDLATAGSGFQQVVLLLGFFYARPSTVLILDEPDAHLHVILQKQIFDRLRQAAASRSCQLIVATHSEVLLEATSPDRIISFFGPKPHVLLAEIEREQVREALKRLTALELLLAEQSEHVLYVEDETDFNMLRAWARVLNHRVRDWFEKKPFVHPIRGRNVHEARAHFFALRAIRSGMFGFLLLDGDNRQLPEREVEADGLIVGRWKRYEAESYLVHPDVIRRFAESRTIPLLADKAIQMMRDELPPAIMRDPTNMHEMLESMPASKALLPKLFAAAQLDIPKRDYYLVAEMMRPEELSKDVNEMLDSIANAFGI
jgi:hypothetical protein